MNGALRTSFPKPNGEEGEVHLHQKEAIASQKRDEFT